MLTSQHKRVENTTIEANQSEAEKGGCDKKSDGIHNNAWLVNIRSLTYTTHWSQ